MPKNPLNDKELNKSDILLDDFKALQAYHCESINSSSDAFGCNNINDADLFKKFNVNSNSSANFSLDGKIHSFVEDDEAKKKIIMNEKNAKKDLEKCSFAYMSQIELRARVNAFVYLNNLEKDKDYFTRGAFLAQDENNVKYLPEDEKRIVMEEVTHKYKQSKWLYYMCFLCAMCAIVQGMDETVVNGAQIYYLPIFGLQNRTWIIGLLNGAPYLCCAVLGSALSGPMNRYIGRRGTLFTSCIVASAAALGSSFTNKWWELFIVRLLLGLGIGPNSATAPVYSAECVPASIRGAMVMMWQMWTAFGIMLGYAVSLICMPHSGVSSLSRDQAWRAMLGSAAIVPLAVCIQLFVIPESPSWYMNRGQYKKAYQCMKKLRRHKVQAARDIFYSYLLTEQKKLLKEVNKFNKKKIENKFLNYFKSNMLLELFKTPRVRRAFIASEVTMFIQQFCGINVIAYYSSEIFISYGFSEKDALLASFGFGVVNWIFSLPAVYTIDSFGRRSLLLVTMPFLAILMLLTGLSFYVKEGVDNNMGKIACVAAGVYAFTIFYSCGTGPVPFTYSAEVYPQEVRDIGMAISTATTWGFNFLLSLTWTAMVKAFSTPGAFGCYAAWNAVGFILAFLFVPETKGLTLEELDMVFNIPHCRIIRYYFHFMGAFFKRKFLFQKQIPEPPKPYEWNGYEVNKEVEANKIIQTIPNNDDDNKNKDDDEIDDEDNNNSDEDDDNDDKFIK